MKYLKSFLAKSGANPPGVADETIGTPGDRPASGVSADEPDGTTRGVEGLLPALASTGASGPGCVGSVGDPPGIGPISREPAASPRPPRDRAHLARPVPRLFGEEASPAARGPRDEHWPYCRAPGRADRLAQAALADSLRAIGKLPPWPMPTEGGPGPA